MNAAEQLLAEADHLADQRVDEVFLRLLARYDEEEGRDVLRTCSLHGFLRREYVRAAINHHRAKKQWVLTDSGRREQRAAAENLLAARLAFRTSVARCGCSDKYTLDGKKRRAPL